MAAAHAVCALAYTPAGGGGTARPPPESPPPESPPPESPPPGARRPYRTRVKRSPRTRPDSTRKPVMRPLASRTMSITLPPRVKPSR
jgi:hypothetical protein